MSQLETQDRLECMEVRGGYSAINSHYPTAGMNVWIFSQPHQTDRVGGDVYYLSACASGRITRLLLADVSGHGKEVKQVSRLLQKLMRQNVNQISSARLMVQLNRDFEAGQESDFFATSLIGTYFTPTGILTVNSAGHPTPLLLKADQTEWRQIISTAAPQKGRLANLPLGVTDITEYDSSEISVEPGDLCLFYTDGLIEAMSPDGKVLGVEGLQKLLDQLGPLLPERIIPELLQKVRKETGDQLDGDDLTLVLCQIRDTDIPWRDQLLSPVRYVKSFFDGNDQ